MKHQNAYQQNWGVQIKYIESTTNEAIYFLQCKTSRKQLLSMFDFGRQKIRDIMEVVRDRKKNLNLKALLVLVEYMNKICKEKENEAGIKKALWILSIESKISLLLDYLEPAASLSHDITTEGFGNHHKVKRKIKFNSLSSSQKVMNQQTRMKKIMGLTISAVKTEQIVQNELIRKILFGISFPRYLVSHQQSELHSIQYLRNPTLEMTQMIWNLPEKGATNHLKIVLYQSIKYNEELYIPLNLNATVSNIFEPTENSIKVRLLHFEKIHGSEESDSGKKMLETIIVHFHGGGFIALSSSTMQSYTRKWANETHIPIFSVDYRKPPQHRFPTVVQDCVAVYRFITQRISQYLNIKPVKVILAGDSSGGNLVCALMGSILKQKLAPVHGIFLLYPAVDLRDKFTPSFINSFDEPVLYPTLLRLCLKEYLGPNQAQNQSHPLASPLLLTQNFVDPSSHSLKWPKLWPKTIVMIGKKDPLYDDSLRLMQRMVESKIDCHCEVYEHFSHAFLSMDNIHAQTHFLIRDSINFLKTLIG